MSQNDFSILLPNLWQRCGMRTKIFASDSLLAEFDVNHSIDAWKHKLGYQVFPLKRSHCINISSAESRDYLNYLNTPKQTTSISNPITKLEDHKNYFPPLYRSERSIILLPVTVNVDVSSCWHREFFALFWRGTFFEAHAKSAWLLSLILAHESKTATRGRDKAWLEHRCPPWQLHK